MLRIAEQWHGSDLGLQRQGNEDNYFVRAPLFVVADGMGGAQAGEVASEMAVEAFGAGLPGRRRRPTGSRRIIEEANRRIHERSRDRARSAPAWARRSPPPTSARTSSPSPTSATRAATCVRDGELTRLTRDHSLVGELVARGKLTEEQAESHPQRSVITRALGPEPSVAGRHRRVPGPRRRPVPALLGRPDVDGARAQPQAAADRHDRPLDRARPRADRRRQRRRRPRQHHGHPVPAGGGRAPVGSPLAARRGVRDPPTTGTRASTRRSTARRSPNRARASPGRRATRGARRALGRGRRRRTTRRPSTGPPGPSRSRRCARARSRSRESSATRRPPADAAPHRRRRLITPGRCSRSAASSACWSRSGSPRARSTSSASTTAAGTS